MRIPARPSGADTVFIPPPSEVVPPTLWPLLHEQPVRPSARYPLINAAGMYGSIQARWRHPRLGGTLTFIHPLPQPYQPSFILTLGRIDGGYPSGLTASVFAYTPSTIAKREAYATVFLSQFIPSRKNPSPTLLNEASCIRKRLEEILQQESLPELMRESAMRTRDDLARPNRGVLIRTAGVLTALSAYSPTARLRYDAARLTWLLLTERLLPRQAYLASLSFNPLSSPRTPGLRLSSLASQTDPSLLTTTPLVSLLERMLTFFYERSPQPTDEPTSIPFLRE